ncbi:MAG: hypothetical protein IKF36_05915 [Bacilli bacterium]|nr:hypothetical protein [Bacilli bacterium]
MKKRIIIIIGVVVICVSVLILILCNYNSSGYSKELKELIDTKVERDELTSITCSKELDESKIDSIEIDVKELSIKKYKGDSNSVTVDEYKITDSDVKKLKKYIDEYNLPAWTNLPVDDIEVINEDKESIILKYDNSKVNDHPFEFYIIDINKGTKKEYYNIVIKFKDKIESLMNEDNKVKTYNEKNGEN